MDTIEFANNIPAEKLAEIFKDYFEQHMAVYDMTRGIEFVSINSVDINKASIMYSLKTINKEQRDNLYNKLNNNYAKSLTIYGKTYNPTIFMNGDLLCITINK